MKVAMQTWLAMAIGLALGSTVVARDGRAQVGTVGAEAYGAYAKTASVELPRAPSAALAGGVVMAHDEAPSLSVPNLLKAENLFAAATGAGGSHDMTAQGTVTLESVDILNGLLTADLVVAIASSAMRGTAAQSNADGAQFADLVVNGVALPSDVEPNTRIDLPGVGYVVLNEQIPAGDGTTSTGLTLRMIHVVLRDAVTGATTGEIVVGAVSTYVRQ